MKPVDKVNRWLDKCVVDGDCLLWQGCTTPDGYPRISVDGNVNVRGHRYIYQILNPEEDIAGAIVRHACDTPLCIKPEHLSLGTVYDNMLDRDVRLRCSLAKTTPDNVRSMRALYSTGEFTQKELGNRFNLNYRTVSYIVNNKTWQWVQ